MRKLRSAIPYALILGSAVALSQLHPSQCGTPSLLPEQVAAILVALCYGLIGLGSFFMLFSPKIKSLGNDLRQGRINCTVSGCSMLSASTFLALLAFMKPYGPVPVPLGMSGACVLIAIYAGSNMYLSGHYPDDLREPLASVNRWISHVSMASIMGWSVLAQTGQPVGFSPLWLVTGLFALSYVASTVAGAKRALYQLGGNTTAGSKKKNHGDQR